MFIEVDELKQEPLHVRHVYPVGDIQFKHDDARLSEPVTTDFVVTHRERELRIGGTIQTSVLFNCSRCAKEFSKRLATSFDLFYLPQPQTKNRDDEVALKYDDMEVGFYDGIRLDVDLMVLEQIELAIPMQFICDDECKGLCYVCGADLNEGPCLCSQEDTDPRLMEVLQELRKKMDK